MNRLLRRFRAAWFAFCNPWSVEIEGGGRDTDRRLGFKLTRIK